MLTTRGLGRLIEPLTGRALEGHEVRRRSVARAAEFARHGLRRHDRVFFHHGNTIEFFVDLLAAWRLGAAAVPVDGRLVPSEIAVLAGAARPKLSVWGTVSPPPMRSALEALGVIFVETRGDAASTGDDARPITSFDLDDEALILFTSGTTGDPKGVVHTHRTLRARWMSLHAAVGIDAFRRTLCLLPTHFGHGLICNCLFPWAFGQDLYIRPPFRADLLVNLGDIIDQHEITFMSSVPSVWRLGLKIGRPPRKRTLRRVFCGSAPLSAALWRAVREWTGTSDVMNVYGITETGSWLAGTTASNAEPEDGLIGNAWGGALAVLSTYETQPQPDFSAPCGPHTSGYVWVNTPALMKGYLGRDDLTSKVVIDGWFSTGDVGFVDEQGRLYLRGRVRDEINKSGQKVYPGDVDAVIEQFDQTVDVCAFAVPDPLHGEDVGVAVVLQTPDVLDRLYEWTSERLGSHQVPQRWYLVSEIPRTPRGKVNRQRVAEGCESLSPAAVAGLRRAPMSK